MKVHITNLYNFNNNDEMVKRQHLFADAGKRLGFLEMGIFNYPAETDSYSEMSKRQDGIIASLEKEDVVFFQLPTKNGYDYENLLFHKVRAYRNTKLILVIHDTKEYLKVGQEKYVSLFDEADAVIVPSKREKAIWKRFGVSDVFYFDGIPEEESRIKKILMDAWETVREADAELLEENTEPNGKDEVQIAFCLYDQTGNYSVWVGVAMQSVIENTESDICFHILHDATLNDKNRKRIIETAQNGGKRVVFHPLDLERLQQMDEQMGSYTIGALFRILLPEMVSDLSRIIYLDADVLVHRDIRELWDMNIEEYDMAAVSDADVVSGLVRPVPVKRGEVLPERYFNSGVLYMNLDRICQKGNMCKKIFDYLQYTQESNLPDQDALNVIYGDNTLLLDGSWNVFVRPIQNMKLKGLDKAIYHFVGTRCVLYTCTDVDQRYYETTMRTPWGETEAKTQLDKALNRETDRVEELDRLLMCCMNNNEKKRIFYGEESVLMESLYDLIGIRENDYRVRSEKENNANAILPCKDFMCLLEETDPYIVYVQPQEDGGKAIENLKRMGLSENDFFVIPRLVSAFRGGYL